MAADSVLVIDAGTSALRALIVGRDGAVTPLATEPWPMFVPDDAAPFGREFNVAAIRGALDRLVAAAEPNRASLCAVAVTGQREGIALVGAGGEPLFASPNIDARAAAEGMAIDAARGPEVYRVTGHLPSLMQAPAKLAWMRAHRPALAAAIEQVLPLADWLAMLLTGAPRMSRTLASEIGLLDVSSLAVPDAPLDDLSLPARLLPPVLPDGSVAGTATAGPLAGLPIVLAGADTQCALVGMGVVDAGDAGLAAGWSAPLQLVTARPIVDPESRTWTGVHVAPERWILE